MDDNFIAATRSRKAPGRRALKQYMQRAAKETRAAAKRVPLSWHQNGHQEMKHLKSLSPSRMMEEVESDGHRLKWASNELKRHRGIVVAAVRNEGLALRHAHPDLREDPLISFEAVKSNPIAMEFAPPRLAADHKLALHMVQKDGLALQHLHLMQNDVEVVTTAIRQNGWAFRFASPALRADPDIVALAVEAHGRNLCYVSDERLRSDRELLLRIIARNAWALRWASDDVRLDRDFLLRVVEVNGWALRFALEPYTTSRGLALTAASQGARTPPRCNQSRTRAMHLPPQWPLPYGRGGHDALLPAEAAFKADARRSPSISLPWRESPVDPPPAPEPQMPEQLSQSRTHPVSRQIQADQGPKRKEWRLLPPSDADGPTLEEFRLGYVVQVV